MEWSDFKLGDPPNISLVGRLKSKLEKWQKIGSSQFILDVISTGYKIPFFDLPKQAIMKNNKSSLEYPNFVRQAIDELLEIGSVVVCDKLPIVINPLTVSVQPNGKKRLILDLRMVNLYLYKQKIKYDDISVILQYLQKDDYMFSFDLKSGYHHIEMYSEHTDYLAFAWPDKFGNIVIYKFVVLPFGLSSAPYIFTKLLRPVISWWRSHGHRVSIFLDDGLGNAQTKERCEILAKICCTDLLELGFLPSPSKCEWCPKTEIIWTGNLINSVEGRLFVSPRREEKILKFFSELAEFQVTPVRSLAKATGMIISALRNIGNIGRLMTRYLFRCINKASTWDENIEIDEKAKEEIVFWKDNFRDLNGIHIWEEFKQDVLVYSDASSTGGAGYVVTHDGIAISHEQWSEFQRMKSSTWRELYVLWYVLVAMCHMFVGKSIAWFTDNQAVVRIMQIGSSNIDLQNLSLAVCHLLANNNIQLLVNWVPRNRNIQADFYSKMLDIDDYGLAKSVFEYLNFIWGPLTIDRCYYNAKLSRFNSLFWNPGTEAIDAFSQNWANENNYIMAPTRVIAKALMHMGRCGAKGVVIVPVWKSSAFWPILTEDGVKFRDFVLDYIEIPNTVDGFEKGKAPYYTLFANRDLKFKVLALKIDFKGQVKDNKIIQ